MSERVRIAFCGESTAGKTSLIDRFSQDFFEEGRRSTRAVDSVYKDWCVDEKIYEIQLVDTVGQEKNHSVAPSIYRNCHWVFVCYDPLMAGTEESHRAALQDWKQIYDQYRPEDSKVMLVLTKYDKWSDSVDEIRELGKTIKDELQADALWVTSSKTNEGVPQLFTYAVEERPQRKSDDSPPKPPIPDPNPRKDTKCCT